MSTAKKKVASKLCIRCDRVLPLAEFYANKEWSDQSYHDVWCKECAAKYCKDETTLEQYCFENNREWKKSFYDSAMKKAQYILATNADYINPKTSAAKKKELIGRTAARQFFSFMNMVSFYGYVDNTSLDGFCEKDKTSKKDEKEAKDEKLKYNRTWGGYFTKEQIDALEDIYNQYEEDFVLDNVNIRDYARKVAKASQNADIVEDNMRRGRSDAGAYKEAQKIFDDLSKSANFAACRRKPGEASGLGSLGEIILRLELNGSLNAQGFAFPKDDVDKIIEDFRHTLTAIGIEGQL